MQAVLKIHRLVANQKMKYGFFKNLLSCEVSVTFDWYTIKKRM